MKRIMIQMDEGQLNELALAAGEEKISRAEFARSAIARSLAERRRRKELQAVIEAYQVEPPENLTLPKSAVRKAWPK